MFPSAAVNELWSANTTGVGLPIVPPDVPFVEDAVIFVSLDTVTLNWLAPGVPEAIPFNWVPPLNTLIVQPLPVITGLDPSLSDGIPCASLSRITV